MTRGFDQLGRELAAAERRQARERSDTPRHRGGRLLPALCVLVAVAVVAVALVVGGGGGQPSDALRHTAPRPGSASAPPTGPGRPLPCAEAIGFQRPPREMRRVLGVVALPAFPGMRHALQTSRVTPANPRSRLFAKWGLWVRAGASFSLIVPADLRGRLTLGWGNAGEHHNGSIVTDPGCRARGHRWINFAGGYWVTKPMCATVVVSAQGRRRRVAIGIGKPCPGQLPPPQPTAR